GEGGRVVAVYGAAGAADHWPFCPGAGGAIYCRHSPALTAPKEASMSPRGSLSRRQLLQATGLNALALGLADPAAVEAAAEQPAPPLTPLNRFPRMVQEHFVEHVRAAEEEGNRARAALKTKADAEGYVEAVRKKIHL